MIAQTPRYQRLPESTPTYTWQSATYALPNKDAQVLSLEKISSKMREHMDKMASTYIWESNIDHQTFDRSKDLQIKIRRFPKQVSTCCCFKRSSFHYEAQAVQPDLQIDVYVTPEMKRVAKRFFKSIPNEGAVLTFSFQRKQEVPN